MVTSLAHEGMTVVWSTAYLEEAERCSDLLLMNEGRVLYQGPPAGLMSRMEGRSYLLTGLAGNHRAVLRRALRCPEVIDGVLQGASLRLVLATAGQTPAMTALQAGDAARWEAVRPRLEDAFMALVGVRVSGDSPLADAMTAAPRLDGVDENRVIEAAGLTRRFGDFVATDQVNFTIRRGEIFGLLGPNGAGKSTTFKMMCGLLQPSAGTARVMGLDLVRHPGRARQQLGYMAQKFALYSHLSVAQNLQFFSGIYGVSGRVQRERIAGMVEVFGLAPLLSSSAGELTPGFKQRLALACALMHQPALLFLDEPTSGVDPVTRREFWSHINGLVEKGVTVMVTTHFMDEAEYCDRIGLVYRGRMIASGTPEQLKQLAAGSGAALDMEEAFIALIERDDREREGQS